MKILFRDASTVAIGFTLRIKMTDCDVMKLFKFAVISETVREMDRIFHTCRITTSKLTYFKILILKPHDLENVYFSVFQETIL